MKKRPMTITEFARLGGKAKAAKARKAGTLSDTMRQVVQARWAKARKATQVEER